MATEMRCPRCKIPLVFTPRALVQHDPLPRVSPALYCTHCRHAEEWPGYDLIAVTSDAVQLLTALRIRHEKEGAPSEVIEVLARMIQRFNNEINRELIRLARFRLGI